MKRDKIDKQAADHQSKKTNQKYFYPYQKTVTLVFGMELLDEQLRRFGAKDTHISITY